MIVRDSEHITVKSEGRCVCVCVGGGEGENPPTNSKSATSTTPERFAIVAVQWFRTSSGPGRHAGADFTRTSPSNAEHQDGFSFITGPAPARLPTEANRVHSPARDTPGFPHVGIVPDHASDRRVCSGICRLPRPFHSGAAPYSPQSPSPALKTTMLRASQMSLLTHSLVQQLLYFNLKLRLHEAEEYPGSRTLTGLQKSVN
ncbi:hypothetical protein PR048_014982 [Dryococelus australis]|uniref:Uncharacterized protein n=1 Tax=Dryococelus australis TaxID=614101 RepID=A0ABQ9HFN4_9NEOP|nr:hypothetical protein PR048_014982 [Dryococelus australis]